MDTGTTNWKVSVEDNGGLNTIVIKEEVDLDSFDYDELLHSFPQPQGHPSLCKVEIKQEEEEQSLNKLEIDQTSQYAGFWKVELKRDPKIDLMSKIYVQKSKFKPIRPSKIPLIPDINPTPKNAVKIKQDLKSSSSAFEVWSNWDDSDAYANPTLCHVCDKSFQHSNNLKVHLYSHMTSEQKSIVESSWEFVCSFCSKRFRASSILDMHVITHTKERPFKCRVAKCGKTYTRASSLNVHMRAHSKKLNVQRPISCSLCGQLFTVESHLRIHMKYHQGLKEHVCKECGRRFTHKSNLTSHINNMHRKIRHACRWCEKTFSQKQTARIHELRNKECISQREETE